MVVVVMVDLAALPMAGGTELRMARLAVVLHTVVLLTVVLLTVARHMSVILRGNLLENPAVLQENPVVHMVVPAPVAHMAARMAALPVARTAIPILPVRMAALGLVRTAMAPARTAPMPIIITIARLREVVPLFGVDSATSPPPEPSTIPT